MFMQAGGERVVRLARSSSDYKIKQSVAVGRLDESFVDFSELTKRMEGKKWAREKKNINSVV